MNNGFWRPRAVLVSDRKRLVDAAGMQIAMGKIEGENDPLTLLEETN